MTSGWSAAGGNDRARALLIPVGFVVTATSSGLKARSNVIRRRGRRSSAAGPVGMEILAARLVDPLVGVGAEKVALSLEQVGREPLAAIAVIIG